MSNQPSWEIQIRTQIESLYESGGWRDILGSEFVMEPGNEVVVQELDVVTEEGRFRLAATRPNARPPFEWLFEITSEINTGTAMRHYLIREDDIVVADRRVLTPLDEAEALVILTDLELVLKSLAV